MSRIRNVLSSMVHDNKACVTERDLKHEASLYLTSFVFHHVPYRDCCGPTFAEDRLQSGRRYAGCLDCHPVVVFIIHPAPLYETETATLHFVDIGENRVNDRVI